MRAARVHHAARRCGGGMAARGTGAAGSEGGALGLSRPRLQPYLQQALLGGLRHLGYVEGHRNPALEQAKAGFKPSGFSRG